MKIAKKAIIETYFLVGGDIKDRRKSLGLSGAEVARRVGISAVYYWELEKGRKNTCSIAVYKRLCKVLGAEP